MKHWLPWLLLAVMACDRGHADEHGHDHDGHDDHGHGEHGDGHEEHSITCTRWTDDYELFVELSHPEAGEEIQYAAHVTKLLEFIPVTKGELIVEWRAGEKIEASASVDTVSRAGIFTPSHVSPRNGTYSVQFRFTSDDGSASFDCGEVTVGGPPSDDGGRATLSFLKEQQWTIPFETAYAHTREMTQEVELPAVVEPSGTDQLTVSAPTSGRFFHNPKLSLAEGLHIDKGTRVGTIAPTVAGEDYSELTRAVDEARLAKKQAQAEVKRLRPLVNDGLLPEKRLTVALNEVATQNAKLRAAQARIGRVEAPGGKGGLTIKSSLGGVVTEILVANGEPVEPGAPLLRIGGERSRWLRARFVIRPDHELDHAEPIAVRPPGGERVDVRGQARLLSEHPIVDPKTQLATWIAKVNLGDDPEAAFHEMRSGTPVVLLLSVGKPSQRIAVPRGAVVDINTRQYVFVQVDGESFEKRRVTLGVADNDYVEIVRGVKAGERVVTVGGYDIHLASIMGGVESHKH